ncbi:MAG: MFS transporter [Panacibacter sp.]
MLASNQSPRPARIAVSSFFFISGLCFATWTARIPDIQHHIGLSKSELGSVLFASPIGSMLCLPLAGWLVTSFGSRACLVIGSFIYALVLCSIGIVNTTWELVAALFFFGVAGNLMNISVNTQAVGVEAQYKRSIMASFHGLWSLAGFSGGAIGTLMVAQHISPLIHFIIVAVLIALAVLVFFRYALNEDDQDKVKVKFEFKWSGVQSIFTLGIVAFCCMGCEGCMFDWSGIYFRDVVKVPLNMVPIGLTAFMATMATGRFIADKMVTKFGATKVLQASGIMITSGLLIAVIFPWFYAATFGFLLTGFGVSSVVPLAYGIAGKSKKISSGIAISLVSSVGFLGFLLGPPFIGYIADALNLQWSFGLMAILGFGTALLASKAKVNE